MTKKLLSTAIIASALSLVASANAGSNDKGHHKKMEKCAGEFIAVGKNDCGNLKGTHSCSGQSTVRSADEWIYLPKGICDKIHGARVVTEEEARGVETDPSK